MHARYEEVMTAVNQVTKHTIFMASHTMRATESYSLLSARMDLLEVRKHVVTSDRLTYTISSTQRKLATIDDDEQRCTRSVAVGPDDEIAEL